VQRHGLGQPGGFLLAELYDPVDIRGRPAFGFIKEPHNQCRTFCTRTQPDEWKRKSSPNKFFNGVSCMYTP